MRSTRLLSKASSEHEDVTSRRHAKDKAKNESFRDREWIVEETPSTAAKPPGLENPWRGEKAGRSYRLISGIPLRSKPSETLALREELRKKHTKYLGRMVRKTKKGVEREAWVSRPLKDPVAGVLVTLPPWTVRLLSKAQPAEQDKILDDAFFAAAEELRKAGWQPFALDIHEDTAQPHATISCLRVEEETKKLIDMPSHSSWTLSMDRLARYGIEHPDATKRQWLKDNLARGGETPDLRAYRAADGVLARWVEDRKVPALAKSYLDEYVVWQSKAQNQRLAKMGVKILRGLERRTKQMLVSAALLKLAGLVKHPIEQARKEKEDLDRANEAFYRVH